MRESKPDLSKQIDGNISGKRLEKLWIFVRWPQTFAKLSGADEAGANQFALAPDQRADSKNLAPCSESKAEQVRYREAADLHTRTAFGNIDDRALDPRRIRRRD